MNENTTLFASTPIPRALATLAIPTIISQLITMVYNLADTFFVGQTNDPYKVAAVSVASVLFFMLNAWANLFGIGGGTLMAQLLGLRQEESAKDTCAFSLYGAILVACLYALVCFLFSRTILGWIGATENTMTYAVQYLFYVIVLGGIPATLSMTMSHLLRSAGYSRQAGFGLSFGGVLNIALDPLFMFVLLPDGREVLGAALATMLSNMLALLYYIVVFFRLRGKTVLSAAPRRAARGRKYAGRVLSVGVPSALSNILACVAIMLTNGLYATYGDVAVAANGIFKKAEMLPLNTGTGICQGMIPLVSYNYASGNHKRMKEAIRWARISGLVFIGLCLLLFEVFAPGIARLFIADSATVSLTANLMRIGMLATPFMFFNFQMCYTFQAMGQGPQSLLLSACRQGIANIPILFLMNHIFGMYGVTWTQLIADGITLAISVLLYGRLLRKIEASGFTPKIRA